MARVVILLIGLIGCATTGEIGTLCNGYTIEPSNAVLPLETMNAMLRECRVVYHGCLAKVIASPKYERSWYAICRRE